MSRNKRASGAKAIYQNFSSLARDVGPNFEDNPALYTQMYARNLYRRKLSELAVNRFKWYGLPRTINQRFLEVTLFRNALAVMYFDRDPRAYGFHALASGVLGTPNMEDDPTAFRVQRSPLPEMTLTAAQCVPIWANTSRIPDHDMIEYYANRLATYDTTLDINALHARKTKVIYTNENTLLTARNISQSIALGQPEVYVQRDGGFNPNDHTQVLDLSSDVEGLEKFSIVRGRVWAEAMMMLGINAATTEKKERVVEAEVDQNDDQVMSNRFIALNERKAAAIRMKERFGLDVRVEYNSDIDGVAESIDTGVYSPGKDDPGQIEKAE